jgi:ubiquinone/menaquinone biosynthesis C-methylase UbiE
MTPPPHLQMLDLITGYWVSQSVHVAAVLGVADHLIDGPKTSAELATATGAHASSLYRLLRALASVGIFTLEGHDRFRLTPLSECLLSDRPGSQRALAIMNGEEHFRAWGDLLYSVQTGKPAFDHVYGKPVFDYIAGNPRAAAIFDDAMTGVHGAETAAMVDAFDFSRFGTVIDVGGGNGSVITAILQRYPAVRGILYDRPHVVERARPRLDAAGVSARCQTVSGDFFSSVPPGADAYLMRHIIHDWDDDKSLTILRNCRKVMTPAARLLLIETVIPPGNEPCFAKFLDLTMLAIPGGLERTEAQYRTLFASAGFRLERIVPTKADVSVIEGVPV